MRIKGEMWITNYLLLATITLILQVSAEQNCIEECLKTSVEIHLKNCLRTLPEECITEPTKILLRKNCTVRCKKITNDSIVQSLVHLEYNQIDSPGLSSIKPDDHNKKLTADKINDDNFKSNVINYLSNDLQNDNKIIGLKDMNYLTNLNPSNRKANTYSNFDINYKSIFDIDGAQSGKAYEEMMYEELLKNNDENILARYGSLGENNPSARRIRKREIPNNSNNKKGQNGLHNPWYPPNDYYEQQNETEAIPAGELPANIHADRLMSFLYYFINHRCLLYKYDVCDSPIRFSEDQAAPSEPHSLPVPIPRVTGEIAEAVDAAMGK